MIVKLLFGSHLYGLDSPDSDRDYKGIFLPTRKQLLLGQIPKTYHENTNSGDDKNSVNDIDFEAFSLHEFVRLAYNGETVALDMLHARDEHVVEASSDFPIFQDLYYKRHMFYCTDMKAYLGYVRRQAAKYGVKGSRLAAAKEVNYIFHHYDNIYGVEKRVYMLKGVLPQNEYCGWVTQEDKDKTRTFYEVCGRKIGDTLKVSEAANVTQKIVDGYGERAKKAEMNQGIDFKAVSHALRAGYQLYDIYKYGDFEYPLQQTEYLKKVKTGELDFKTEIQPQLEQLVSDVEQLSKTVDLPKKPNRQYWDHWLINKMEQYVL